ncbi:hypothetical protein TraAM80_00168 [Trypanosoma rangeli]|uniref:Uncharacterized protein n=1 Tax=Trypanosoma rangeli TaxID=5698 RepID=A0A3S5ISP9_TRYRA|nr:uncharacterized protein TraAM80_00168 [Trypanosoma rangeli]RNF12625.1 hypothetical protein TraAM80_00168 [Trypanosoma rangeli]|eukprot:RNF12625.1 hypothetical protein TraAM80_00168 [Trypanosoma rangeli]
MIARRHKHTKHIPQEEVFDVLNRHEPLPAASWLQLPVVRNTLLIWKINSIRCLVGKPSWLINSAVDEEFCKVKWWMAAQETSSKNSGVHRPCGFVPRELFVVEVLDRFHVANMYQRMM